MTDGSAASYAGAIAGSAAHTYSFCAKLESAVPESFGQAEPRDGMGQRGSATSDAGSRATTPNQSRRLPSSCEFEAPSGATPATDIFTHCEPNRAASANL